MPWPYSRGDWQDIVRAWETWVEELRDPHGLEMVRAQLPPGYASSRRAMELSFNCGHLDYALFLMV